MNLTIIAAIGKNYELGKDNQLIWHFPADLKFFKNSTKGHTIVMGRKTFDSLPGMLPNRKHIVISKSHPSLPKEVEIYSSIEAFMDAYKDVEEEIYCIGGAMIYQQMLPFANRLLLTEIDKAYDADVFFPAFDKDLYTRKVLSNMEEMDTFYQHVEYRKVV
ncbi:MAG: dihydrofolate reductase [Holdemanella sp.]|nr:dihydrofolate reductase [Holdemanella sp.]